MNVSMDGAKLRDGIFALNTRRFGSVAEVMIKRLGMFGPGRNQFHDLHDDLLKHRVEVKFSKVLKKAEVTISESTVLRCILEACSAERMVLFAQWHNHQFDCNIQQIKRSEFEFLYYGLFFFDCIKIFRIESTKIGAHILYSDKQHKGNVGEGQFHINQDTLQRHLDHYLYKSLTYDELLRLLR